jgi:hypothetical protein
MQLTIVRLAPGIGSFLPGANPTSSDFTAIAVSVTR